MDSTQLTGVIGDFNYLLGRIGRYLHNNQYVYLRAFDSWVEAYNGTAALLNADRTVRVPVFAPGPGDLSSSGKSVRQECVDRFIKTIRHQVARVEEKIEALETAAAERRARTSPLERFFPRDADGLAIESASTGRALVVAPGEEARAAIGAALQHHGVAGEMYAVAELGDSALGELCRALHSCRLAVIDLTGRTPRAMLALGLACGAGRPLVTLQRRGDCPARLAPGQGHVDYADAAGIAPELEALLPGLLEQTHAQ